MYTVSGNLNHHFEAVTTDSTHPQAGLFNQDAKTIARAGVREEVTLHFGTF
jgi:hypothetical protein